MPFKAAEAAKDLGESGQAEAVIPLIQALVREQRSVRFAVVDAILALGKVAEAPVRQAWEKAGDPAMKLLLFVIHGQLERKAAGLPMVPTKDIVKMPTRLVDEITREMRRG